MPDGYSATGLLINALARAPRPARELAAGLDVLRSTGIRYPRQRVAQRANLSTRSLAVSLYGDIWRDAAEAVGAQVEELGDGFFEIRAEDRFTRVWFHHVMLDFGVTLRLALDKTLVHQLLSGAGLPVPEYRQFNYRQAAPALAFLDGGPYVVKPADGASGGEGATAGVRTRDDFARARLRASRVSQRLLIERQVPGHVYRLLLMDGELLDVIRRHPPRLVGDGRSTVADLIFAENRRRLEARGHAGVRLLTVDLDALLTLGRAGLSLTSVPSAGNEVQLKTVTNQNRVEDNETVRGGVSPELLREVRAAVERVGVRLAGVDIIASDVDRSLRSSGGAIVEVNGTPGLHYHYQVADEARATRVAIPVLARLLSA